MNIQNFQLLKEDDEHYHIGHPNGRKLMVKKQGLSPKAHEVIKKYAKGGLVSQDTQNEFNKSYNSVTVGGSSPSTPAPAPTPTPIPPQQYAEGGEVDPIAQATALVAPGNQSSPIATPATPPIQQIGNQQASVAEQSQDPGNPFQQKGDEEEQLLTQEQQNEANKGFAQSTEGQEEAKALGDYTNKLDKLETPESIAQGYKAKDDALLKAYTDNKLDPDRYINNLSLPSKISAGIGILLSGLGGGASHQKNMALDVMQNAINNDIEAQKNEQGKNINLWRMNREALHDDQAANLATQNQLYTGVQAKLMQAASNAKSPIALTNATSAVQQIEQQKIQNRLQLGLLGAQNSKGISQLDPAQLVPMLVKDPVQQKEVLKEIQDAQNTTQIRKEIGPLFDQASKDVLNPASLAVTPSSISRLRALALPLIHDKEGRVNEFEQKTLANLEPSAIDIANPQRLAAKKQGWIDFLNQKASAPAAKAAGIDLNKFASTSQSPQASMGPQEQQYAQWAKANPQDPRSALVLKKLGIQ